MSRLLPINFCNTKKPLLYFSFFKQRTLEKYVKCELWIRNVKWYHNGNDNFKMCQRQSSTWRWNERLDAVRRLGDTNRIIFSTIYRNSQIYRSTLIANYLIIFFFFTCMYHELWRFVCGICIVEDALLWTLWILEHFQWNFAWHYLPFRHIFQQFL